MSAGSRDVGAVAIDVADVEPTAFVAVTTDRSVDPTSLAARLAINTKSNAAISDESGSKRRINRSVHVGLDSSGQRRI